MVRALTGHDHRNRHTTLLDREDEGKCRFCQDKLENPSHITLECPSLMQLRIEKLKSFQTDIHVQSWEVGRLISFLTLEHIADMEHGDKINLPKLVIGKSLINNLTTISTKND